MHHLGGADPGQTPLADQEAADLIPSWVTTRSDLDAAEQENIAKAVEWSLTVRLTTGDILDEVFVRELHRKMFGDVWRWAGTYRTTARNIGVDAWLIPERVAGLLADASYWVEHETFSRDELAIRSHHRLVSIHPFPNGNGRHARLATDLLVESLGGQRFSWGIARPDERPTLRREYIDAIITADRGDISALLAFARS